MRFSYSNISTFAQCRYRWYLQYREKLKTIPDTSPDCALWLGLGLHKGIETGSVEEGVAEYKSHYNIITDAHLNYIQQLEHQIPRVLDVLPQGGEHELKIETDDFVGFIDYVHGDTLYDFKFSNNIDNYLHSPQLSLYKHYLEMVRPDLKINHLKYVFVPKIQIRQKTRSKPPETLAQFRTRLQNELDKSEIKVIEVDYDESSVSQFHQCCNYVTQCKEFPKNVTRLCGWCQYEAYCQRGEDWMIL